MQSNKLRGLILASIFAAITAILAQVQVQLWIVPFTGQTLAVGLAATILGSRYGTLTMIIYLLLGAIGIPVYSGLAGGPQILVGPTGGYIVGFIPTAFIIGFILERTSFNFMNALMANVIGMFVTLAFGMVQLKFAADLTWQAALTGGVYPFLVMGIVKAILASWIGIRVRKGLFKANLIGRLGQI